MEELLATTVIYGLSGEFGRITALLTENAQNGGFSTDIRVLVQAALDLRFDEVKSGMDVLRQHNTGKLATIALTIELLYLNSCPLRDNDRTEIIHKTLELDFVSLSLPMMLTILAVAVPFSTSILLPLTDLIENKTDSMAACCALAILLTENPPERYADKLIEYMKLCLNSVSSPIVSLCNTLYYLQYSPASLKEYLPLVTSRYQRLGATLKDLQTLALFDPSSYESSVEVYQANIPPETTIADNIRQVHFPFSRINQLSALLSIACFNTEAELNSALFTTGKHILLKDIGSIRSYQQLNAACGFLIGILRACPLVSVCDTLSDLLAKILADSKIPRTYKTPLQVLRVYLLSAKALLQYSGEGVTNASDTAEQALSGMKQIMERLDGSTEELSVPGINARSMLLTIDDLHILMMALSGKLEKALSNARMMTELDIDTNIMDLDAPASPSKLLLQDQVRTQGTPLKAQVVQPSVKKHSVMNIILSTLNSVPPDRKSLLAIIKGVLPSLIAKAKHPLENMVGIGPLHNSVRYCNIFPDTLALSIISKYIIQILKTGCSSPLPDDEASVLNSTYNILHSLTVSSARLRLTNLYVLSALQEHQALIKRVYTLSSFASEHGFIGLTTDEFFLAATSSNIIGNTKDVQLFLSQAILLDPTIEKTPEFASVVSKIYATRGDWDQAIRSLTTILTGKIIASKNDSLTNLEILPLRVHIALLKLRLADASGYTDLKSYLTAFEAEISAKGRRGYPSNVDFTEDNLDYVHMQLMYIVSKITIYILINAGTVQLSNITSASDNLFSTLHSDYQLPFYEHTSITADIVSILTGSTDTGERRHQSAAGKSFPYFAFAYGLDPFPLSDIFVPPSTTSIALSMAKSLVVSEGMSVQAAVASVKPYAKINKEIGDFMGFVALHIKNDKAAYIQHFLLDNSLDKNTSYDNASPAQLFSLASAYQFVGNAKDSNKCLETLMNNCKKYVKSVGLTPPAALLFKCVITVLYSRSLCKIHYFLKAEKLLVELSNTLLETWKKDIEGYALSYTIVFCELVKLLYRMGKEADIGQLADSTLAKLIEQYDIPQNANAPINQIATEVIYLAVYAVRYRMALKNPMPTNDEKITKLRLALNWFTSGIMIKTAKLFNSPTKPKILICNNIFSSGGTIVHNAAIYQDTQVSSPMVACRARVIAAELCLDLAAAYLEPTGIVTDQIIQKDVSLDPVQKGMTKDSLDLIKRSLDFCESAKAYLLGAILFSVVASDYVTASEYTVHALELPATDNMAEEFYAKLKELKSDDNDSNDMDDFNMDFRFTDAASNSENVPKTPFEQVVYKLKKDLTCDRAAVLDSFLLQSCSRHDPWNFYNLLFGSDGNVEIADIVLSESESDDSGRSGDSDDSGDEDANPELICSPGQKVSKTQARKKSLHSAIMSASSTIKNQMLNSQALDRKQEDVQFLDGYWFFGLGFICLKTGRVKDGVPNLIIATKTHTLQEVYKARAYFILGVTYINSSREPLFGFQSALTTKSTSAVAMQRMAMKLSKSATNHDDDPESQAGDSADAAVPDMVTIEAREDDLQNAIKSLKELGKLASRNVFEADSLYLALSCYTKILEYRIVKDRISRIMLDEGKGAKSKLIPLESKKDKIKEDLEIAKEDLLAALEEMDDNTPNIVVLLTCLGVIFTHLKNHPRARTQFKRAAGLITDSKELIARGQQTRWLDLDAAVSANLALADLYITSGKLSNAIKSLEAISHLDLLNSISYELYGIVMEKEASYNDACKYYESAWLLSRGAPTVAFRLAYNYIKSNRYEDAIVMCQLALREWSDFGKLRKDVLYLAERRLRTGPIQ